MENNNSLCLPNSPSVRLMLQMMQFPVLFRCWWGLFYNIVDQIYIANASYLGSLWKCGQYRRISADGVALAIAGDD